MSTNSGDPAFKDSPLNVQPQLRHLGYNLATKALKTHFRLWIMQSYAGAGNERRHMNPSRDKTASFY